jgi:hypothetical protein
VSRVASVNARLEWNCVGIGFDFDYRIAAASLNRCDRTYIVVTTLPPFKMKNDNCFFILPTSVSKLHSTFIPSSIGCATTVKVPNHVQA